MVVSKSALLVAGALAAPSAVATGSRVPGSASGAALSTLKPPPALSAPVAAGDENLGVTLQSATRLPQGIRVRLKIDNLTEGQSLFVHHQANQSDSEDYFFLPHWPGTRKDLNTSLLSVQPLRARTAELFFPLSRGQRPGLLVVGEDRPPFDQVAIALPNRLNGTMMDTTQDLAALAPEFPAPAHPVNRRVSSSLTSTVARPASPPPRRPVARPLHPSPRIARSRSAHGRWRLAARRPSPPTRRASVIFLPPSSNDHVLGVYSPPLARFDPALLLWQGHRGPSASGWARIHQLHPRLTLQEIAYTATYPQQVWTDGHTYLFVRWGDANQAPVVLQVAGNSIVNAQLATYDELTYWVGDGRIYPELLYQGER